MEILKRAEPKDWICEFTCSGCGSELRASGDDLKFRDFSDGMSRGYERRFFVTCPVCNTDKSWTVTDAAKAISKLARDLAVKRHSDATT